MTAEDLRGIGTVAVFALSLNMGLIVIMRLSGRLTPGHGIYAAGVMAVWAFCLGCLRLSTHLDLLTLPASSAAFGIVSYFAVLLQSMAWWRHRG